MQNLHKHIFPDNDKIFSGEFLRELNSAIKNLPEENRKVINLHFEQKLSRKEIALQLGWSLSKVNTKITRGISLLKWKLNSTAFHSAFYKADKLMEQMVNEQKTF
jgi:RNA polymerase sigma factor (sigma-70 family)